MGSGGGARSIDVVIITWNDGRALDVSVASALASCGVDARVIVVDNGSDEPVALAEDPRITLMREPLNLGVAGGRNRGVAASTSPLVCLLDSDARLHDDTLAHLIARLEADPSIGLIAPVFDGQDAAASGGQSPGIGRKLARLARLTNRYATVPAGEDGLRRVDFVIGACQVFSRTRYDAVGGLNEDYFYGPEDVEFCLRLRQRGWAVAQDEVAHCYHPPRRSHRRLISRRGMLHALAVVHYLRRRRVLSRRTPS